MTTSVTRTDAGLRERLFDGDQFTARELAAIRRYEETVTGIVSPGFDLPLCPPEGRGSAFSELKLSQEETVSSIRAHFGYYRSEYEALDALYWDLRLDARGRGPVHTNPARDLLERRCNSWYHELHVARREACRFAFGDAGPLPLVNSQYLTFRDAGGIRLDGTIAAESDESE